MSKNPKVKSILRQHKRRVIKKYGRGKTFKKRRGS